MHIHIENDLYHLKDLNMVHYQVGFAGIVQQIKTDTSRTKEKVD